MTTTYTWTSTITPTYTTTWTSTITTTFTTTFTVTQTPPVVSIVRVNPPVDSVQIPGAQGVSVVQVKVTNNNGEGVNLNYLVFRRQAQGTHPQRTSRR